MQAKQLRDLEAKLWEAADQLRANSKLTASEYSLPILGLIFLRQATNKFQKAKIEIEKNLPSHPQRGKRAIQKDDFSENNVFYLPEQAHFDYLVALPEGENIAEALDNAMKLIEEEHESLRGVLPKTFSKFNTYLLRELIRIFNEEVLQQAEGDLFGKIYEYFLNKFAMTGAQEGGEFFTPMSLVQTIVNIIEPDKGIVFDPACGSAGMFVQTGYFIEKQGLKPAEKVTFYGQEKAELNTNLAKMNMAVHGLEGKIVEGNTFYEDKHNLVGKCDFVMANPPFNVDSVDKKRDFVKNDARLRLQNIVQLPNNDNANYLWILYFYNYLNATGKAGFVMASSASDAGHSERDIREKLVQTGAVDVMMAIGNNFFYTRSLPCTLWFLDRAKEEHPTRKDQVLMLDARKIYRKVTQKINDFSPEQLQNLLCVVELYRGKNQKFGQTLTTYLQTAAQHAQDVALHLGEFQEKFKAVFHVFGEFAKKFIFVDPKFQDFTKDVAAENQTIFEQQNQVIALAQNTKADFENLTPVAKACKDLQKIQDQLLKKLLDTVANAQKEFQLNKNKDWKELNLKEALDALKKVHAKLNGNPEAEENGLLYDTDYFWQQAQWLISRFPEGEYRDIEGLCKVVNRTEIAEKDYSLSPGRYVGVDTNTDEEGDYEARLQSLHTELDALNQEAALLAKTISENFKLLAV